MTGRAPLENPGRTRRAYQQPIDVRVDLLPLRVPEIRYVLWALGQAVYAEEISVVFAWPASATPPPGARLTYLRLYN